MALDPLEHIAAAVFFVGTVLFWKRRVPRAERREYIETVVLAIGIALVLRGLFGAPSWADWQAPDWLRAVYTGGLIVVGVLLMWLSRKEERSAGAHSEGAPHSHL